MRSRKSWGVLDRVGAVLLWACVGLGWGCAIEGVDDPPALDDAPEMGDRELPLPKISGGLDAVIHVGGICSTRFTDGKKAEAALGTWPDLQSVDAAVDQRSSMATAVADLRDTLDARCTGDTWCYLYGYSNGGAVISKTLATHTADRWNILWVLNAASNEGGSELSGGIASVSATLGVSCDLASRISPTDHRAGWNHNDTGGNTVYQIAGHREWWYTGKFPDFFEGASNDGAVAYHSAGGLNDLYDTPDDDPWLCYASDAHWDQHEIAFSCSGYDLDHDGMMEKGLREIGG